MRVFYFGLSPGVHLLGRSRECDFRVDYETISRRHAKLEAHGEELTLTDLGSRNGSFVDEQRVTASRLRPGTLVRFGSVSFSVAIENKQELEMGCEDETDPCDEEPGADACGTATVQLTTKQRRVFDLLVSGQTEKQIARQLGLSIHTVNSHTRAVFRLFNVNSRPKLLARIFQGKNGQAWFPGVPADALKKFGVRRP